MSKKDQEEKPHVVTITGGTGGFAMLSGLKEYPIAISAIVNMVDDGGSTGILRDEMGVLPPGDVRQCLAALARSTPEVRELFAYRFENEGLKGHNFGNLFLSALEKTTGSFKQAVRTAGRILNVYGRVIPVTEGDMRLVVELNNGVALEGEDNLDHDPQVREIGVRGVSLARPVSASPEALEAIAGAELVVIGPGDFYANIVPMLLVDGLADAIRSSKARVVFVANLTNKKGQTEGFCVHEYAEILAQYLGDRVDALICNTTRPSKELEQRYVEQEGADAFVECDEHSEETSYTLIKGDLVSDDIAEETPGDALAHTRSFIRHDSQKLAQILMSCLT